MKRSTAPLLVLAAAASLALASQARAQTAGTYAGTIADGNTINFTVSTDGNGALAVTSFGYGLSTTCHPGTTTFNTGWGLGPDAVIKHNKASFIYQFGYLYATVSFKFSGDNVTGTVASLTPTFAPYTTKPKKSVFCSSPRQTYTASFQSSPDSAVRAPAANSATVYMPSKK